MISDRSLRPGSRNALVSVSRRTAKPSAFSQFRIIEAHRSGSCPLQPPHTIIASRMLLFLCSAELSGRKPRPKRRGTFDGGFELDPPPLVGRGLEGFHGFQ